MFLVETANEYENFRKKELDAISVLLFQPKEIRISEVDENIPLSVYKIECENEKQFINLCNRSVFIRNGLRNIQISDTKEDLLNKLKTCQYYEKPYSENETDYRLLLYTINRKLTQDEKIGDIERILIALNWNSEKWKLNLKLAASRTYCLFACYSPYDRNVLVKYIFGEKICEGGRKTVENFTLKNRICIANTSMVPLISMMMVNMGEVKKNDIILDPFVGSGSIIVAAAYFGAYVFGSDLNWTLLVGRGKSNRKGEKWRSRKAVIKGNMEQYNLLSNYVDSICSNVFSLDKTIRFSSFFDGIITDPPYGVRESANGKNSVEEFFDNFLRISSILIKLDGYLVFWYPSLNVTTSSVYERFHKKYGFEVRSIVEQKLKKNICRYLISMKKIF
ncbi:hypothetical protein SNEBB_001949 [Seison nebaliae]|nr:hypothetical protein SNEBB_001949 [Seison nebaliae]